MIRSKKLTLLNLKHGFFNSIGGYSKNIYKSLNCGPGSLDNKKDIKKNLLKVRKKISKKAKNIFLVRQFHSNKFIFIDEKYKIKKKPKADAIITNQKNLPIAVLTADCAPILIYDNKIKDENLSDYEKDKLNIDEVSKIVDEKNEYEKKMAQTGGQSKLEKKEIND